MKQRKISYSQQREAVYLEHKQAEQKKRDVWNAKSRCCNARIKIVYDAKADENQVRTIRVCCGCETETQNIKLFDCKFTRVSQMFIDLEREKKEEAALNKLKRKYEDEIVIYRRIRFLPSNEPSKKEKIEYIRAAMSNNEYIKTRHKTNNKTT